MKLNSTSQTPPAGWFYVQFQTGHRFNESDFEMLVLSVLSHRNSNKLPHATVEEVTADIHNQICSRSPSHVCRGADFEPASLSASTVLSSMNALASTWKETPLVPLEEANRRADICRRCPHNQPMKGCFGFCSQAFAELFKTMNRGRETPDDEKLMGCDVCGCSLRALVHFPVTVLQSVGDFIVQYY